MTRQVKELYKKINEIQKWVDIDDQLGCGCAPAGAYDEEYHMIADLEQKIAEIRGFNDYMTYQMIEYEIWMIHHELKGRKLA